MKACAIPVNCVHVYPSHLLLSPHHLPFKYLVFTIQYVDSFTHRPSFHHKSSAIVIVFQSDLPHNFPSVQVLEILLKIKKVNTLSLLLYFSFRFIFSQAHITNKSHSLRSSLRVWVLNLELSVGPSYWYESTRKVSVVDSAESTRRWGSELFRTQSDAVCLYCRIGLFHNESCRNCRGSDVRTH
ncbi:hypothetical protein ISN45_Aa01g015150 [Arabidopsis thaliana x Arabidopsis arenosa]|uniref:Uncharacterized protein n=1 Tax=Arabidopsis thaliana x Arabidopsis arenosa TaxID=1240361 RepID=A0A8T2CBA8_9BRAS|nr:hypothetical protein ISN45_Aa01g015150 [Arabidopsis thaliana x Arabidopsis arenosa]